MTTHKIIGQFENETVHLFDSPVVCVSGGLQEGDIVEVDGHYVRMYRDGHTDGLRYWFITEMVLEALAQRHEPEVKRQAIAHMQRWNVQAVAS